MKRIITRFGDIFSVKIDDHTKKYFQYVANDLTQLNSDVIRAFKKAYRVEETPVLSDVISDDIDFYAHCVTSLGIKLGFWEKVGNIADVEIVNVFFKGTNDYGGKLGEEPIRVSSNWYVWKINEDFIRIGKLEGIYKDSFAGLVINPKGIIELLRGNKYPINYPD